MSGLKSWADRCDEANKYIAELEAALQAQAAPVWTKEKPTKPGWYWYRGEPDLNETMIWLSTDQFVLGIGIDSQPIEFFNGEFAGPLSPPGDAHE